MELSLAKLLEAGSSVQYVAGDPRVVEEIRRFEEGAERPISEAQDTILRNVVKAAVKDKKRTSEVVNSLALSGKALSIVENVQSVDAFQEGNDKYIPIIRDYKYKPSVLEFGECDRYEQPESIFEMIKRAKGVVGKRGQIVWPAAFAIAEQYYGEKTWTEKSPKMRTVFPFLPGSNGKPYFKQEGVKEYQKADLEGKTFEKKKLRVGDYGETLMGMMLRLMDKGFPDAPAEWKVSRVLINNGEKDERARLGSLGRHDFGVCGDYVFGNADPLVWVGASLES